MTSPSSHPLPLFNPQLETRLSWLMLLGAGLFLYLFGVHGFLRSVSLGFDFEVFHRAGEVFLTGGDPWRASIGSSAPFAYPPHVGSLVMAYGVLPYGLALAIHTTLNVLSIGAMVYLANRWFVGITSLSSMRWDQGLCLAIIIGNPSMAHSVFEGQFTLLAAAAALLAWHFHLLGRAWLAGVCLGVATIKPQVSFLLIIWLLLSREFRMIAIAAALAGLMLVPSLLKLGVVGAFESWFAGMAYYGTEPANKPGFQHVVGIESFLATLGITGVGWLIKPWALVALVLLYVKRACVSKHLLISVFFVIALTFIYGHDTDYAMLAVLWSFFLYTAFQQRKWPLAIFALGLVAVFFFPQRVLRLFDAPPLYQWRTFVILIWCYLLYRWLPKPS